MTVASTICKHVYQGNGSTRRWPFSFALLRAEDLEVYVTEPGEMVQLLRSGYLVDLEAKCVVYPANASLPALPEGGRITLRRWVPFTQDTELPNQGEFFARTLEKTYDLQEFQVQQLWEELQRCLKVPVDDIFSLDEFLSLLKELLPYIKILKDAYRLPIGKFSITREGDLVLDLFGAKPDDELYLDEQGHLILETQDPLQEG